MSHPCHETLPKSKKNRYAFINVQNRYIYTRNKIKFCCFLHLSESRTEYHLYLKYKFKYKKKRYSQFTCLVLSWFVVFLYAFLFSCRWTLNFAADIYSLFFIFIICNMNVIIIIILLFNIICLLFAQNDVCVCASKCVGMYVLMLYALNILRYELLKY